MLRRTTLILGLALAAAVCGAQNVSSSQKSADEIGWTSSVSFDGSANSQEQLIDVDSSVGYAFTKHWSADVVVPLSFASSSTTTSTTGTTGAKSTSTTLNSIGNIRTELNLKANGGIAHYVSTFSIGAPTGSRTNGVSTGRANLAWNNHLEHAFGRLTPFIEASVSNGLTDTGFYRRPYTTLGFMSQFSGGSSFDLGRDFSIGASLYDLLPTGTQKMYSKLVNGKSGVAVGRGDHGRGYELASETTGDGSLTRDNGGSAWVEYSPGKVFDFQVGYTHSVHLALDSVVFNVGVNVGKLLKRSGSL